ncbi:hypothetical protein [Nocardia mexicana]|uniref:Uncharacterized protein n=2 Tax=Nocardia mexicana TaxID=279262 RepID=A0A370HFG1_9NOCA|nr:hypothetical protein [Nocardia mexicana]RDI55460.1 hypothetical protein DFR68_101293 [Nocardia mexicana]
MNAAWSAILSLLAITAGMVYLVLRTDGEYERGKSAAPTHTLRAVGWTHEAPDYPVTVAHAHRIMQQHRACDRADCLRKHTAYQVLVEAGHIKPDSGRNP